MSGYVPMSTLPLFAPPPSEDPVEHLTDRDDDGVWLARLRDELRKLYEERKAAWPITYGAAFVTADDARKLMERDASLRPPPHRSNNVLGSLFLTKGWRRIGDHISTTTGAHRNRIGRWEWAGE